MTVEAQSGFPPFSGDDVRCSKCGNDGASTTYRSHGRCIHQVSHNVVIRIGELNERLCRECRRCGYRWDEAVMPSTILREVDQ